jgi:hypothetical protein
MELFNFSALTHGASVKAYSGVTGRVTRIAQRPGALKVPGSILSGIAKSDSGLRLSAGSRSAAVAMEPLPPGSAARSQPKPAVSALRL